ncbi:MAG: sulfotransferase domain-containing protein [Thalassobaculales bacterium]
MGGILWLASYPKSGNTWLRAFLHNLLLNPAEGQELDKLGVLTYGDSQAEWYRLFDPRPPSEMTLEEAAALRPRVQAHLASLRPDVVFVKTHNMVGEDRGHRTINLDVSRGAIYVVRNPLDVAISYADHFGQSLDEAIANMGRKGAFTLNTDRNVFEVHGTWSQHVESWTAHQHPGLLVLRYEDMLEKTFRSFGSVMKFLGIDLPKQRLERAIRLSSFRQLQEMEKAKGFRERSPHSKLFFRSGRAGQWKSVLSPEQVARIVADHREQMSRFGYVPKGH